MDEFIDYFKKHHSYLFEPIGLYDCDVETWLYDKKVLKHFAKEYFDYLNSN